MGFVDHAVHPVSNSLDRVLRERDALFGNVFDAFQHMRLLKHASGGNAADQTRKLDWSGGDGALADGDRDSLAGVPLAMEDALNPFGGGHETGFLRGQINSRLVAEAEPVAPVGESIDTHLHADRIEENVAGLEDSLVEVGRAVGMCSTLRVVHPAMILAAEKCAVAGTVRGEVFRRILILQHSGSGDDFKNGTGG